MGAKDRVDDYAWLTDDASGISEAGCVTIVVGLDPERAATAFGIDLAEVVDPAGDLFSTAAISLGPLGSGDTTDGAGDAPVVVVEDNGYEGSREVVLKAASKRGKAASICWNVEGLVLFTCARKGKLLFSGELGTGEDLDDLPRRLVRLAEAAEDDDADAVAIGAAMVEAFTGHGFTPAAVLEQTWHPVTPHVEPPRLLTPENSALRWGHQEYLDALMRVPAEHRRAMTHLLLHQTVERAAMGEDPAVAEVLATVTPTGPGQYTRGLEAAQRRWSKASHDLWVRQDEATNGGGERPFPEEERRVYVASGVGQALQFACSDDELTALLGVAAAARFPAARDKLGDQFVAAAIAACALPPQEWPAAFAHLPAPLTAAERDQLLVDQQRAREEQLRRWQEEEDDDDHFDDGYGGFGEPVPVYR